VGGNDGEGVDVGSGTGVGVGEGVKVGDGEGVWLVIAIVPSFVAHSSGVPSGSPQVVTTTCRFEVVPAPPLA